MGHHGSRGDLSLERLAVVVFEGDGEDGGVPVQLLEHHLGRLWISCPAVYGDDVAGSHVVDVVAGDVRHVPDGSRGQRVRPSPVRRRGGPLWRENYSCCYSVGGLPAEVGVAVTVVVAPARLRA